jgi:hypothetical protein
MNNATSDPNGLDGPLIDYKVVVKDLPIGRVFKMLNNGNEIRKLNVSVESIARL